jgi:branched-chain amino acid transport system permease protein
MALGTVLGAATIVGAILVWSRMPGRLRTLAMLAILIGGFFVFRAVFDPGVEAVEAIDPGVSTGYLGGLGLPVIIAWPVGGLLAAGAAWIIGKTALGCGPTTSPSPRSASPRSSSRS